MRCPKCHYLSFDPEPRCKNCGYDLEVADTDLAMRTAETAASAESEEATVPDLPLRERPVAAAPITLELGRPVHAPAARGEARLTLADADVVATMAIEELPDVAPSAPALPEARRPFRSPHTTTDLPLFVKGIPESDFPDEATLGLGLRHASPVVSAPRPPLAVRRAAPEPARARAKAPERRLGPLDRDLLEDLKRVEREEAAQARAHALATGEVDYHDAAVRRVPALHRIAAAAVDSAVLGGIAVFVFWATLRLCNVSLSGLGLNALLPLVLFLALMDVGYLLMFTAAGGQTVGKMLMHIRVVGEAPDHDGHVSIRQAAWRAALTLVSVIGLGLGWLPFLFGSGLAMHDRLAHTRVVRA